MENRNWKLEELDAELKALAYPFDVTDDAAIREYYSELERLSSEIAEIRGQEL